MNGIVPSMDACCVIYLCMSAMWWPYRYAWTSQPIPACTIRYLVTVQAYGAWYSGAVCTDCVLSVEKQMTYYFFRSFLEFLFPINCPVTEVHDNSCKSFLNYVDQLVIIYRPAVSGSKCIFCHDWMVWAWLQALDDVVERPTGLFFLEKCDAWKFGTRLLSFVCVLFNIWS